MMALRSAPGHPSAGELVRQLDGELDTRAEARLADHLARCAECSARRDEIASRSDGAARIIRDFPVRVEPDSWRRRGARAAVAAAAAKRRSAVRVRRGWAAAAAVAAILLVSLAADPVRAWVMQRLTQATGIAGVDSAPTPGLPPAVVGGDGSIVSFSTDGPAFQLNVERTQQAGELLLQVREGAQATAQVTNGGSEALLVLPTGLRIENAAGSRASYRVTLPASVERITVRIGDGTPLTLEVGGAGWQQRIPLDR